MNVYAVTVDDCEITMIKSIHQTMEGALEAWNKARLELIEEIREMIVYEKNEIAEGRYGDLDLWEEQICNLENTNYETIRNWPQNCPHITEYPLCD